LSYFNVPKQNDYIVIFAIETSYILFNNCFKDSISDDFNSDLMATGLGICCFKLISLPGQPKFLSFKRVARRAELNLDNS
jgi:hypothetical protein